eukprot:1239349-Amphidinium_carterae.1
MQPRQESESINTANPRSHRLRIKQMPRWSWILYTMSLPGLGDRLKHWSRRLSAFAATLMR